MPDARYPDILTYIYINNSASKSVWPEKFLADFNSTTTAEKWKIGFANWQQIDKEFFVRYLAVKSLYAYFSLPSPQFQATRMTQWDEITKWEHIKGHLQIFSSRQFGTSICFL